MFRQQPQPAAACSSYDSDS